MRIKGDAARYQIEDVEEKTCCRGKLLQTRGFLFKITLVMWRKWISCSCDLYFYQRSMICSSSYGTVWHVGSLCLHKECCVSSHSTGKFSQGDLFPCFCCCDWIISWLHCEKAEDLLNTYCWFDLTCTRMSCCCSIMVCMPQQYWWQDRFLCCPAFKCSLQTILHSNTTC